MKKLKILVVDSSVMARMATVEAVNSTEYGIVEKTASNGSIAFEWLQQCEIDVILIDVMLISKEGLDLVEMTKRDFPEIQIIIMSSGNPEISSVTLDLFKTGAIEFIQKPSLKELEKYRSELKAQLQTLFIQIVLKKFSDCSGNNIPYEYKVTASDKKNIVNHLEQQKWEKSTQNNDVWGGVDLILIASSTGGPVALDIIFNTFPPEIHKPILIVQHMPAEFTNLMAQKLDEKYHLNITEGKDKEILKEGQIIIAPGGRHMTIEASEGTGKIIRLLDTDFVNGVKPSADVLFQSVADTFKQKNILVVILTGMGNDGTRGIIQLKKNCNCYCITQSESTCVVYGMPRCVYDAGLSDEVADLKDIAFRIHQVVLGRRGR